MKVNKYPGSLYDFTAGVRCGVLVTEDVMKRLAKLQHQHLEAVKRLLHDNKDGVFPSMWTLHYPGGEQTTVRYIDKSRDIDKAIKGAVHGHQPKHIPLCFIASSMDEAKQMADAEHEGLVFPGITSN